MWLSSWAVWQGRCSCSGVGLDGGVKRLRCRGQGSWQIGFLYGDGGAINLVFVVAFVLIYTFSGLREFQVSRFARLGDYGSGGSRIATISSRGILGHSFADGVGLLSSCAPDSAGGQISQARQVDLAGLCSSCGCVDCLGARTGNEYCVSVHDDAHSDPLSFCHGRVERGVRGMPIQRTLRGPCGEGL